MVDADLPEFATLLDSVCALLSTGKYTPSDASTMLFFRKLAPYPMADVRRALDKHVEASKFPPTPAEIIEILHAADGRLGADEAWAIALTSQDEADTVVWTEEIAEAWGACVAIQRAGDEVGARMAFRQSYTRLLAEARAEGKPAQWLVSEGHDAARRADAVRRAVDACRLPASVLHQYTALPAPTAPLMLESNAASAPKGYAALLALRDRLKADGPHAGAAEEARNSGYFTPIPASACPWNRKEAA